VIDEVDGALVVAEELSISSRNSEETMGVLR